jgi:TRAP-type transport system small permease protein
MIMFRQFAHVVEVVSGFVDRATKWLLIFFSGLIFSLLVLQVLMRYVIRSPLIWVEELTSYTLAFLVLWGCACYVRSWQHIKVDTLLHAMPLRFQATIILLTNVLLIYFGYMLATAGYQLALLGAGDLSDSGIFNLFWPRQAMVTGGILIMLQAFNNICRILSGQAEALGQEE